MTLQDFLLWMGTTAGSGAIASFILERIKAFQELEAQGRLWVSFGSMAILGILSYVTLQYVPAETLNAIAPYFLIIASAFVSVFSGEFFHRFDKSKSEKLEQ